MQMGNVVSMYGNQIYPYPQTSPFYDELDASGFYFLAGPYISRVQDVCLKFKPFEPESVIVEIINSQFAHNYGGIQGGGMYLSYIQTIIRFKLEPYAIQPMHTVIIRNSSFIDNIGHNGWEYSLHLR